MASSVTEICNLALGHLGHAKGITSLNDRTPAAEACSQYYELARQKSLRDAPWPFATTFVALGLVEEEPTSEWGYSYRYPSNALMLRRILSGVRTDTRDSRVPYRIASDDDGLLLYTDLEDVEVEYTRDITNVQRYPSDYVLALSYLLASMIAAQVTTGDKLRLGDRSLQLYGVMISRALANAKNEEQPDIEPDSEFIRIRE